MTLPTLQEVRVYPVKSLGGFSAASASVEPRGLAHDRRWMVVDPDGRFLTQRTLPRMARVSAFADETGLRLSTPGMAALELPPEPMSPARPQNVQVWSSLCEALPMGEEADEWLSAFLGVPCCLIYMPDRTRRPVSPDHRAGQGIVSFADGYPLLLLGDASLADLNGRLDRPVPMSRFRPNLVVSGAPAYAEDGWTKLRIGEAVFHGVKPCARCGLITVDQETGRTDGPEPLRTLAAYRRRGGEVLFGQLLIPDGPGVVRAGDAVELL